MPPQHVEGRDEPRPSVLVTGRAVLQHQGDRVRATARFDDHAADAHQHVVSAAHADGRRGPVGFVPGQAQLVGVRRGSGRHAWPRGGVRDRQEDSWWRRFIEGKSIGNLSSLKGLNGPYVQANKEKKQDLRLTKWDS